jgi:hypothetical protein
MRRRSWIEYLWQRIASEWCKITLLWKRDSSCSESGSTPFQDQNPTDSGLMVKQLHAKYVGWRGRGPIWQLETTFYIPVQARYFCRELLEPFWSLGYALFRSTCMFNHASWKPCIGRLTCCDARPPKCVVSHIARLAGELPTHCSELNPSILVSWNADTVRAA